jgi:predicted transcriptional regulator of viral defense system
MLARRGTVERAARRVYRLADFPATPAAPYLEAVLWTGQTGACLSHDTALALHELSDINPGRIHVTVPRDRRLRRAGGDLYVVHQEDLREDQIGWWERIPIVTAETAIGQGIDSGMPSYLLTQALGIGARRGAITTDRLAGLQAQLEARNS